MGEAAAAPAAKGWLRLLIESVDVPLDHKDPHRLHFSTVQSLIPGAHGLYYRGGDGARKALAFDGAGHVSAPENGWEQQNIFVHLAHGHRPGAFGCGGALQRAASAADISEPSSPVDAYTTATDRFEKTVAMVQKMMTASSIGHRSSRKSSKASTAAASPESSEEDTVSKRYKEENESLQKKIVDLEGALTRSKEALEDAANQESHEKLMLREAAHCVEGRLDEAERMAEAATRRACEADHQNEENRARADKAEWSLGEHRAWLAESKERVSQLEGQLAESREQLDLQRARADKAEWTLGEHMAWLEQARTRNAELERALSETHDNVSDLRDRAESAEWNLEEQRAIVMEERAKNKALADAADTVTSELREKIESIESEMCNRAAPSIISPPSPPQLECDTTVASSNSDEEKAEEERDIEEEISVLKVEHQQAAAPPQTTRQDTVEMLESRVRDLEADLSTSRQAIQDEFEARLADVSRRAEDSVAEVIAAKKRLEQETEAEVNTKIQELTEKEDELNNLHTVIEDLREKLRDLERARSDAEWHLGEHRDWLKNERDKVSYLEEQLRRVCAGEQASRPVSRKNSAESGFGGSTSTHTAGDDSGGERKGSESPPAPRKMKITSAPDDLAAELMALSKDKQRLAMEIRELKSRPDPTLLDAERRAAADALQTTNEKCARLEAETAHYKDIASRVNMDAFNAKDGRIAELEKARSELEWALGEKRQEVNDAKWRIGELEGQLAQLKTAAPAAGSSEGLEQKEAELRHARDESHHLQQQLDNARWRLGELDAEVTRLNEVAGKEIREVCQLRKEWNDQKWRIGELESGYAHHEWVLSTRPTQEEVQALRDEKSSFEQRLAEAWRAADDAKWRLGELEAALSHHQQRAADDGELARLREENGRLLTEWNDQKWRIGELESGYAHHEWIISELRKKERLEDGSNLREHELEWKLGEAQREIENLRGRLSHLESELARRDAAAAAERPGQLEESMRALRGEKDNLDQRVRQLDQLYNDTKWRNGELEAGLAHTKWLLDEERNKVARIADCNADATRDGSFVVRHRRPGDARLWQLAMKTSADDTSELRAVTLTIDEPSETDAVFVIGSFSTWECCARLARPSATDGKRQLTLHLPKGRHEFRFIVDGGWSNSAAYPTVPNPFGTANNWISVE